MDNCRQQHKEKPGVAAPGFSFDNLLHMLDFVVTYIIIRKNLFVKPKKILFLFWHNTTFFDKKIPRIAIPGIFLSFRKMQYILTFMVIFIISRKNLFVKCKNVFLFWHNTAFFDNMNHKSYNIWLHFFR